MITPTLFHNGTIGGILPSGTIQLRGDAMKLVDRIGDGWLATDSSGHIAAFGDAASKPSEDAFGRVVDLDGGWVLPAFCDSHTHLVYAGSREQEFEDKIRGLSYEEIARRGGGILNSADRLHDTTEDDLYGQALVRACEIMAKGTGAVEIKSGYGLNTEDELKMLRVIGRLARELPLTVRITFLGAHAVGRAYTGRQTDYVDMICSEMIPEVARQGLAQYVDVFCDTGFFTVEETARILGEASRYGMRPKIHANELGVSGGVQVGVAHGAVSVDHLERVTDDEIAVLASSSTIPTVLPGASFFLGMPYAPARRMIDAGLPVAIASDYNPGSSPSGDMRFAMSLACIKMKLTPEEALNAATINGAAAMGIASDTGSITVGKRADLMITHSIPSLAFLPYAYTTPLIDSVMIGGNIVSEVINDVCR